MIQCMCGGLIEVASLTSGRSRWCCRSCGRYEVFEEEAKDLPLDLEDENIHLNGRGS